MYKQVKLTSGFLKVEQSDPLSSSSSSEYDESPSRGKPTQWSRVKAIHSMDALPVELYDL